MSHRPDLSAYFRRITYSGSREPALETLNGIAERHVQSIPFENIDVLLGRGISIEAADIEQKLVHQGRGGYCFEHNTLLLQVLEALGFHVTPLSARVRLERPRDFTPARTHLLLQITLAGKVYLADVGVGGFSVACALPLVADQLLPTPHEPRRLLRDGAWHGEQLRAPDARIFHQVQLAGSWHDVYEFTLEPMPVIDRVVANWYTSMHPASHFRDRLLVARANQDGRVGLVNRKLTRRYNDGRSETRELASKKELLGALEEHFGLQLPLRTRFNVPELDALE